jgi:hypothetical protein
MKFLDLVKEDFFNRDAIQAMRNEQNRLHERLLKIFNGLKTGMVKIQTHTPMGDFVIRYRIDDAEKYVTLENEKFNQVIRIKKITFYIKDDELYKATLSRKKMTGSIRTVKDYIKTDSLLKIRSLFMNFHILTSHVDPTNIKFVYEGDQPINEMRIHKLSVEEEERLKHKAKQIYKALKTGVITREFTKKDLPAKKYRYELPDKYDILVYEDKSSNIYINKSAVKIQHLSGRFEGEMAHVNDFDTYNYVMNSLYNKFNNFKIGLVTIG